MPDITKDEEIAMLRRRLELYEPKLKHPCPICKTVGLILIRTKDLKICTCGYKEPYKLKKGQKALLDNRIEGITE